MLGRLILGGITLATVGYGFKKYYDEVCDTDVTQYPEHPQSGLTISDEIEELQNNLHELTSRAQNLYAQIANKPEEHVNIDLVTDISSSQSDKDVLENIKKDLKTFEVALQRQIEKMESVIDIQNDYLYLTESDKFTIRETLHLAIAIVLLIETRVHRDGKLNQKYAARTKNVYEILLAMLEHQKGELEAWWVE